MHRKAALAESVNRAVSILAREKFSASAQDGVAGTLDVMARLIGEGRGLDDRERSADEELSSRLAPMPIKLYNCIHLLDCIQF